MSFTLTMLGTDTLFTPTPDVHYSRAETLSVISTLIADESAQHRKHEKSPLLEKSPYVGNKVEVIIGPTTTGSDVADRIERGVLALLNAIARGEDVLNIIAHSRGAVESILTSHEIEAIKTAISKNKDLSLKDIIAQLADNEKKAKHNTGAVMQNLLKKHGEELNELSQSVKDNISKARLNLFLIDPVPGNGPGITWNDDRFYHIPAIVNECVVCHYVNEHSRCFMPIYPERASNDTSLTYLPLPGHHGTGSNGNSKDQTGLPTIGDASHVQLLVFFKILAFLNSHCVSFKKPSEWPNDESFLQQIKTLIQSLGNNPVNHPDFKLAIPLRIYSEIQENFAAYAHFNRTSYPYLGISLAHDRYVATATGQNHLLSHFYSPKPGFINDDHFAKFKAFTAEIFTLHDSLAKTVEEATKDFCAGIEAICQNPPNNTHKIALVLRQPDGSQNITHSLMSLADNVCQRYLQNDFLDTEEANEEQKKEEKRKLQEEQKKEEKRKLQNALKNMFDQLNAQAKEIEEAFKKKSNNNLERLHLIANMIEKSNHVDVDVDDNEYVPNEQEKAYLCLIKAREQIRQHISDKIRQQYKSALWDCELLAEQYHRTPESITKNKFLALIYSTFLPTAKDAEEKFNTAYAKSIASGITEIEDIWHNLRSHLPNDFWDADTLTHVNQFSDEQLKAFFETQVKDAPAITVNDFQEAGKRLKEFQQDLAAFKELNLSIDVDKISQRLAAEERWLIAQASEHNTIDYEHYTRYLQAVNIAHGAVDPEKQKQQENLEKIILEKEQLAEQNRQLQEQIDNLTRANQESRENLERQCSAGLLNNMVLNQNVDDLNKQVLALQQEIETLKQTNKSLQDEKQQVITEREQVERRFSTELSQNRALNQGINSANNQVLELTQEIETLRQANQTLRQEKADVELSKQQAIEKEKKTITDLNTKTQRKCAKFIEKELLPLTEDYLNHLNAQPESDLLKEKKDIVNKLKEYLTNEKEQPLALTRIVDFTKELRAADKTLAMHRDGKWSRYLQNALVGLSILLSGIVLGYAALTAYSTYKHKQSLLFWRSEGESYVNNIEEKIDKLVAPYRK